MKILSHSKIYLCGQIEQDIDAAGWRIDLANRLHLLNPTIKIWDPLIKPDWVPAGVASDNAFLHKKFILPDASLDDKLTKGRLCFEANKDVRYICKMLASKCDILIARINKLFTWGSIDELEIAIQRGIPIFLWLPDGLISIYGIAGCIKHYQFVDEYVHYSLESMLNTLSEIDSGSNALPSADPETWLYLTWKDSSYA